MPYLLPVPSQHLPTKQWLALSLVFTLSACSLSPQFPSTEVAASVADAYPVSETSAVSSNKAPAVAQLSWQQFFTDSRLQQALQQALTANKDLRLAMLNVEKVRAAYQITDSNRLPSFELNASQSRQRLPATMTADNRAQIQQQSSVNVGIAAWELDLFGKVKNQSIQAEQQWRASAALQQAAQLTLLSEVASRWYSYANNQQLLKLAEHTAANRQQTLSLTEQKVQLGVENALILSQQQSLDASARADVANYQRLLNRDRNALQLLLGLRNANELTAGWLPDDNTQLQLPEVAAGLPASLLTQRPDLRAAEHQLQAANANIGVARAAYFPSVSLTATAGTLSPDLQGLFDGGSGSWSFVPRLNLPIFNSGSTAAGVERAEVEQQIALTTYQQSIQQAFREVADQLTDVSGYRVQMQALAQQADSSQQARRLSQQRFDNGADSYLQLLDAERSWYTARAQWQNSRLSFVQAQLGLYKALGGGWQAAPLTAD